MTTTSISLRSGNRFVLVLTSVSFKCSSAPVQCCFDDISNSIRFTSFWFWRHSACKLTWLRFRFYHPLLSLRFYSDVTAISSATIGRMVAVWSLCENYSDITVVPNGLRQMIRVSPPQNKLPTSNIGAGNQLKQTLLNYDRSSWRGTNNDYVFPFQHGRLGAVGAYSIRHLFCAG